MTIKWNYQLDKLTKKAMIEKNLSEIDAIDFVAKQALTEILFDFNRQIINANIMILSWKQKRDANNIKGL